MSSGLKLGNLGPRFDDLCCGLKALSCGIEGPTPVNEDELFNFTIYFILCSDHVIFEVLKKVSNI